MEKNDFIERLGRDASNISVPVSVEAAEKMYLFSSLMKEWNEKINLTSITADEEIISKHLIDSLSLAKTKKLDNGLSMIDVGTGAGFPAIPVKIIYPGMRVTLLDSLNKRLLYLKDVVEKLDLELVEMVHARAEDGGRNKLLRENFDLVTARAVASLDVLAELCLPFARVNGYFLCMKGPAYLEELKQAERAIEVLGGRVEEVIQTEIPGTDLRHNIVVIKKIKKTPDGYPRKAGKPSSSPIR